MSERLARISPKGTKRLTKFLLVVAASLAVASAIVSTRGGRKVLDRQVGLTKGKLAAMLAGNAQFYRFPTEMEIELDPGRVPSSASKPEAKAFRAVLEYAFDPKLQEHMEKTYAKYKPDYGAFVAIDARTGQVLSLVSFSTKAGPIGNLALRSSFPSASVFKVVTAAAAIEGKNYSANTIVPFNGANHTLYRRNVMKNQVTRWTRYPTLKAAFANSINTVFGRIGANSLTPQELQSYAERFGFNQPISGDLPVEEGHAPIPSDPWERAETASGFTRDNTMSPLQGALIAATVVNNGVMMEPYIVRSVYSSDGKLIYTAEPKVAKQSIDPRTSVEIRELMRETVQNGTSRKSFRGFHKSRKTANVEVGGKTGSLTGLEPPGKYDWFVGYGTDGERRIAVAALTIHEKYWKVKSSYLARVALEKYFRELTRESPVLEQGRAPAQK